MTTIATVLSSQSVPEPRWLAIATTIVFGATYLLLALGRPPGLRTDRAGTALAGAAAVLALRLLTLEQAARAVDVPTIVLLLGMMIVVAHVRISGFFAVVAARIARLRIGPRGLLAATIALSGTLSAFLVNDVVCVALTPLVIDFCRRRKLPPVPYLIGLATSSNIGSVATITGNPQNIIIGNLSAISYARFAARLAPVAALGLFVNFLVLALLYSRVLNGAETHSAPADDEGRAAPDLDMALPARPARERTAVHRRLLWKCVAVTLTMVALFFAGQPFAVVALAAAAVLLFDNIRPEKIYRLIDWPLLVLFAGLFVVVRAFEIHVVRLWDLHEWAALRESPVVLVSALSVALSNLVSNVPAVLLFRPIIAAVPRQEPAWLALAMSSTLAGNLTMLGSIANLIVVEGARRARIELSFMEFLKIGVPLTFVTTIIGVAWLMFAQY